MCSYQAHGLLEAAVVKKENMAFRICFVHGFKKLLDFIVKQNVDYWVIPIRYMCYFVKGLSHRYSSSPARHLYDILAIEYTVW